MISWEYGMLFHFFNFRKINFKIYMCGCFICVCMCLYTTCVLGAYGGQKKASDPLELELQMKKSYHVGCGNLTWVLYKSGKHC